MTPLLLQHLSLYIQQLTSLRMWSEYLSLARDALVSAAAWTACVQPNVLIESSVLFSLLFHASELKPKKMLKIFRDPTAAAAPLQHLQKTLQKPFHDSQTFSSVLWRQGRSGLLHKAVKGQAEESGSECERQKGKGGSVTSAFLHRMRAVKRTCLLRVHQQLAGPREERHRGREGGGCPGWEMQHAKQQTSQDCVCCLFIMG